MDRIRQLRTERGLSQAKLAVMADMDPATLNRLERGTGNPSLKTLQRIADALDISVAELLEDVSPKIQAPLFRELPDSATREERRLSRFAEAIVAAARRWGEAMTDADTDDHKRFGLIDAALGLGAVIEERAVEEDWDALPNQERLEIVTAMEQLTEAARRGLAHLEASHEAKTQEEQIEQRREQIREMTRRISA
jgi:transcriptional regulator with XRE-family HTH domain